MCTQQNKYIYVYIYICVHNKSTKLMVKTSIHIVLSSSSISWVGIHFDGSSSSISWISVYFDGSSSSISWISVHRNTLIGMFHFNLLLLELIPMVVIQAGNDDADQCSNNKCDNRWHYNDSNYYSCRELIV